MKKLIALLLTVLFITALMTACDGSMNLQSAVDSQIVSDHQSDVDDNPVDDDNDSDDVPVNNDNYDSHGNRLISSGKYTNPKYGWTVDIPSVWDSYGTIIERDGGDSLSFVYTNSYSEKKQSGGHVFTIVSTTDTSGSGDYAAGGELFNDGSLRVYWYRATDVQFMSAVDSSGEPYDISGDKSLLNQYQSEYNTLSYTREQIIDSFNI